MKLAKTIVLSVIAARDEIFDAPSSPASVKNKLKKSKLKMWSYQSDR